VTVSVCDDRQPRQTYLLPADLRLDIGAGDVAPLAGGPLAFATIVRITRERDGVRRERLPWRDVAETRLSTRSPPRARRRSTARG
jgi:hypothetical protein